MVSLGGSEEEEQLTALRINLVERGYAVTSFVYGRSGGRGGFPEGTEIVDIPLADDDPLYAPIGEELRYITPNQKEGGKYNVVRLEVSTNQEPPPSTDVTDQEQSLDYDSIVTSSRRLACKQLLTNTTWTRDQISRAKLFVTPLYLHDLCSLSFARQFDLPVVGLVTSRTGSWWSWYWLDVLPPLATAAVPPSLMSPNFGFVERLGNLWNLFSYIAKLEHDWVKPVTASLPDGAVLPIADLYNTVGTILVSWDWLTDPNLPMTPFLTSTASLQWDRSHEQTKDSIVPSLRNRNGAVFCNLKVKEIWIGMAAQSAILQALTVSPFTVVWRGVQEALHGVENGNKLKNTEVDSSIFVFQEDPPIGALLAHPRHRLLISMCGESDVMAAILFGSPTLCLPVTPDQLMTSRKLHDLGLGLVVSANDVTTNKVKDAIRELTTNRSYRVRGRRLAEEYIDQPLSASDRVLHALEKVMRRPWRYKRREVNPVSLLVRNNCDIIATILVFMTSIFGVAVYVITNIANVYIYKAADKKKEE